MSGKKETKNGLSLNDSGREFLLIMNRDSSVETKNLICLNLAAYTYQEWVSSVKDVKSHGRYFKNRYGETKKSAFAQRESELRNSLLIFLRELKATNATSQKFMESANAKNVKTSAPSMIDGNIGEPL